MGILIVPENALAKRMYDWLYSVDQATPAVAYPREKLIELAKSAGFSREAAFGALKNLEEVVNVASYWDSVERTVLFSCISGMTMEQKMKHIEDEIWFDSLPDHIPKKE